MTYLRLPASARLMRALISFNRMTVPSSLTGCLVCGSISISVIAGRDTINSPVALNLTSNNP